MMDVVIHDHDPLHAEAERVRSCRRDVVVEAEAHGAIALGMMPWRPDERHHARISRLDDGLDAADGRARSQQRHVSRIWRRVGVGVERHRPADGSIHRLQVRLAVHARELRVRGGPWRLHDTAALLPCGGDTVHHLGPLHALGMAGRGSVIAEPIRMNEDY